MKRRQFLAAQCRCGLRRESPLRAAAVPVATLDAASPRFRGAA